MIKKLIVISYLFASHILLHTLQESYFVILAGGSGERLWPLSKQDNPKQFLVCNNNQTMLEETITRVKDIPGLHKFIAVTTQNFYDKVNSLVGNSLEKIIIEPERRDTGPAILLACLTIAKKSPDAVITILPTDHHIPDHKAFATLIKKAIEHAGSSQDITVLGIKPTYPATGYGYLLYDKTELHDGIAPLKTFKEKPSIDIAQQYLEEGNALWNAGIFCAKAKTFIEAFKTYAPEIYSATTAYLEGSGAYKDNPKISVDFAIAEKYPHRALVEANLDWSDVGDLATFIELSQNKDLREKIVALESEGNLSATQKKLVAFVGVHNICLIETDNEILVISKEALPLMKNLIGTLRIQEHTQGHL